MSRIGRQVVVLPEGVAATVSGQVVTVRGPRGELNLTVHQDVAVVVADKTLVCRLAGRGKGAAAQWGTTRARLNNMVLGVTVGWRRELELVGLGFRAQLKGKDLELFVGYSHPVLVRAPAGIRFSVEKELVAVEGNDVEQVGQVAANIRAVRKPEPYKGKGVRFRGEIVRRKVGKVAGSAE